MVLQKCVVPVSMPHRTNTGASGSVGGGMPVIGVYFDENIQLTCRVPVSRKYRIYQSVRYRHRFIPGLTVVLGTGIEYVLYLSKSWGPV